MRRSKQPWSGCWVVLMLMQRCTCVPFDDLGLCMSALREHILNQQCVTVVVHRLHTEARLPHVKCKGTRRRPIAVGVISGGQRWPVPCLLLPHPPRPSAARNCNQATVWAAKSRRLLGAACIVVLHCMLFAVDAAISVSL